MSTPTRSRLGNLVRAAGYALIAAVVTVATAIIAIESGLVDDSPAINRAIPALASVMGVLAYLWQRDRNRREE